MAETIYQRLEQDHREIRRMMNELMETSEQEADKRRELYAQLRTELITHDRAETRVLYEALEQEGETRLKAYEGETEHDVMEFLLKEVDEADPADLHWKARMQVLKEITEHHLEEEEKKVFKKARDVISQPGAERMTRQFDEQKEQFRQQL